MTEISVESDVKHHKPISNLFSTTTYTISIPQGSDYIDHSQLIKCFNIVDKMFKLMLTVIGGFSSVNGIFITASLCLSAKSFACSSSIFLNSSSELACNNCDRKHTSEKSVAKVLPVSSSFFVPFCK